MDARYIDLDPFKALTEYRYLYLKKHIYYRPGFIYLNKGSLLNLSIGFDVVYLPFKYKHYKVRISKGFPDLNKSGNQ